MDRIKVGDYVKIVDWGKFYLVSKVTPDDIFLIGIATGHEYKYSKSGYSRCTWIIKDEKPVKKRSGFGKWVERHGI